jgi:hypothetical protein
MMAKWRELSASQATAAKIPNLIWTDLAANMLVGTKSLLSAFPDTQSYKVRSNKRRLFFSLRLGHSRTHLRGYLDTLRGPLSCAILSTSISFTDGTVKAERLDQSTIGR